MKKLTFYITPWRSNKRSLLCSPFLCVIYRNHHRFFDWTSVLAVCHLFENFFSSKCFHKNPNKGIYFGFSNQTHLVSYWMNFFIFWKKGSIYFTPGRLFESLRMYIAVMMIQSFPSYFEKKKLKLSPLSMSNIWHLKLA